MDGFCPRFLQNEVRLALNGSIFVKSKPTLHFAHVSTRIRDFVSNVGVILLDRLSKNREEEEENEQH